MAKNDKTIQKMISIFVVAFLTATTASYAMTQTLRAPVTGQDGQGKEKLRRSLIEEQAAQDGADRYENERHGDDEGNRRAAQSIARRGNDGITLDLFLGVLRHGFASVTASPDRMTVIAEPKPAPSGGKVDVYVTQEAERTVPTVTVNVDTSRATWEDVLDVLLERKVSLPPDVAKDVEGLAEMLRPARGQSREVLLARQASLERYQRDLGTAIGGNEGTPEAASLVALREEVGRTLRGVEEEIRVAESRAAPDGGVGDLLETLRSDRTYAVRKETIQRLVTLGPAAIEDLAAVLNSDKDVLMQEVAAEALGEIGDAKARPSLELALNNPAPAVAGIAGQALQKIALGETRVAHDGAAHTAVVTPREELLGRLAQLMKDRAAVQGGVDTPEDGTVGSVNTQIARVGERLWSPSEFAMGKLKIQNRVLVLDEKAAGASPETLLELAFYLKRLTAEGNRGILKIVLLRFESNMPLAEWLEKLSQALSDYSGQSIKIEPRDLAMVVDDPEMLDNPFELNKAVKKQLGSDITDYVGRRSFGEKLMGVLDLLVAKVFDLAIPDGQAVGPVLNTALEQDIKEGRSFVAVSPEAVQDQTRIEALARLRQL